MGFSQVKESIVFETNRFIEQTGSYWSKIDPEMQHTVLVSGLVFFSLVAIGCCLKLFFKKELPANQANIEEVTGGISVLLRDLNTKLNNFVTQSREDSAFMRQEIQEIKFALDNNSANGAAIAVSNPELYQLASTLPDLERQLSNLNNRLASYANLMREELHTLREDIVSGRLMTNRSSNGSEAHVGSHVVDSVDFFKQ